MQEDIFLNLCQSATILGYKDYRNIELLVKKGLLETHKLKNSNRPKIKYKDLMNLPAEILISKVKL